MTTKRVRSAAFAAVFGLFLAVPATGQVQEAEAGDEQAEEGHHSIAGRHRITLGLGHTHVSQGEIDGETEWLVAASWALNYDYWINDRWGVGLQNEVLLEQFAIEHGGEELLEREYPVSVIPTVFFKPGPWLVLLGGVGREFASEEDLTLTRLGAETGWHVTPDWEVGVALVWDNKWDYYNSWGLAFGVSRFLGSGR